MARTTWSMISLATHSCATGIKDEISRKTMVPNVSPGLVSHTIRSNGGTFRRARRRSGQVAGVSAGFGSGGWVGIKYQCNAGGMICEKTGSERGPEGPIRHHLPESTGPLLSQGRCMGESDSTETQPSKPVCDSDDRATKVASQVKNWNLANGL